MDNLHLLYFHRINNNTFFFYKECPVSYSGFSQLLWSAKHKGINYSTPLWLWMTMINSQRTSSVTFFTSSILLPLLSRNRSLSTVWVNTPTREKKTSQWSKNKKRSKSEAALYTWHTGFICVVCCTTLLFCTFYFRAMSKENVMTHLYTSKTKRQRLLLF